jgi:hypothetical protein
MAGEKRKYLSVFFFFLALSISVQRGGVNVVAAKAVAA